MQRKRALFIVILLLFAGLFAWRILTFPYAPAELFRAIPTGAVFVSEHDALSEHVDVLLANPLVRNALMALGVEAADLAELEQDPALRNLLRRFASHKTVLAYVPSLGLSGEPAWVLATWAGRQAQLVRWGFYPALIDDLESQALGRGRTGWVLSDVGGADSGRHLSLAVTEGMLLGCLSVEKDAVGLLLRRIEAGAPVAPGLRRSAKRAAAGDVPAMARGIFGHVGLYEDRDDSPLWVYRVDFNGPAGAAGEVCGPAPAGNFHAGGAVSNSVASLGPLLGGAPGALVVMPFTTVRAIVAAMPEAEGVALVLDELARNVPDDSQAVVALCRPGFSGRIMGLRVPTLIVGLRMASDRQTEPAVGRALDRLNARYGMTLIRRLQPEGALPLIGVESVRSGLLSQLGQLEHPTYVLTDGWLIVGSNRDGLVGMLRQPPLPAGAAPDWQRALARADDAELLGWAELVTAEDALRKVAAIYDLAAIARGRPREGSSFRASLELANRWIEAMGGMEHIGIWGRSRDEQLRLEFSLGDGPASSLAARL